MIDNGERDFLKTFESTFDFFYLEITSTNSEIFSFFVQITPTLARAQHTATSNAMLFLHLYTMADHTIRPVAQRA